MPSECDAFTGAGRADVTAGPYALGRQLVGGGAAVTTSIKELRRDLVDPTARLLEFLRKLASARRAVVSDVDQHLSVLWLANSPPTADLDPGAAGGEVIFRIDPMAAEPPPRPPSVLSGWLDPVEVADSSLPAPSLLQRGVDTQHAVASPAEVQRAFDQWLETWKLWAESDRRTALHRDWYNRLADAHQQLDQHADEVELVLSTGMVAWQKSSGDRVRTHILHTRVLTRIDVDTGRIEILVDPSATTRIADRELFGDDDSFDAQRAEPIRQQLRASIPFPLGDDTKSILERWRTLSLARCHPYEHDAWDPLAGVDADGVPELRFSPAIVLRRRDAASLIGYYDRMLEALSGPDAEAPLGLAQLLTALEPEERIEWLESEGTVGGVGPEPLFPLPANDEQRQIVERLRHDNGVVVQGPPGTGKSHSIANLISALLAQGHRVLVTSQKGQALRVLREKLPGEIAELCVSMTDLSRGGSAELNRSVNALSERFGNHDPAAHARQVEELTSKRDAERERVSRLTERIRSLRETETFRHPRIAEGYEGTLGSIAERLRSRRADFGWIPIPLPSESPVDPPLSASELAELRSLLATVTPARRARVTQRLPDISSVPPVAAVGSWFAAEAAAATAASEVATETSKRLSGCGTEVLGYVEVMVEHGRTALEGAGLAREVDPADAWREDALAALLTRREAIVWDQLAMLAAQARRAQQLVEWIGLRVVSLPQFEPTGAGSAGALLVAGGALRQFLAGGGSLRARMQKPVQRAAQPLLDSSAVDGVPPTTPELLDLVLAQLEAEGIAGALSARWEIVGVRVDPALPLIRRVGRLVEAADALDSIRAFVAARDAVVSALASAGVRLTIDALAGWTEFEHAMTALVVQREADAATQHVAEQVAFLALATRSEDAPPELEAAAAALAARDATAYERAVEGLADAHDDQRAQARCDALMARLTTAHAGLAQLLERTAASVDWDVRLATFRDAWAWGKARSFFDEQRRAGLDAQLDAELADAVARVEAVTVKLAAAGAWGHALRRMDSSQARALQVYRQAMQDRGAGKGRYAHQYEAAAREAMVAARGAVPAWIMPLPEVLETVPPDRNSFDVVIVDEASQASIESLFLLWLAPRIIVVGDDRQCTPSQVSHGELQPIFDSLDDFLPDIPHYLRVGFTPRSSLFSLLTTRFGAVLRLREHFRCMPEIIGWSSRQFYADAPLIPLRQYGADRLPPLRTTRVSNAYAEGSATRLRNPIEAAAIVDAIAACLDDPAYDGKSMGVVVLQGSGQIALLVDLLHAKLPAAAWEQRRLRVGTPPDFQGDERDVVFLSMVVADPPRAVTMLESQRRFNVAASRARDQMWLFHSVPLDVLSPVDLRRSLLAYMCHPPAPSATSRLDGVRDDEPHPEFDSLFEQRVFNRIRARGYHVTPQVEVNSRRIDLVVTGAKGRLAVECDGDAFHTSAEQREADLHRELELKRAGWRFWRVRESEFFFDPDLALETLWPALEARGIRPHDLDTVEEAAPVDDDSDWLPAALSEIEGDDGLGDMDALDVVAAQRPTPVAGTGIKRDPEVRAVTFGPSSAEVRAWARMQGLAVGERGRLHPQTIAAWNQAHPDRVFE